MVSIIVPIYKVEKYLRECIESILAQTYTNLEVILVDDGSPDNCGSICDQYKEKDTRVRVIHKANGGLSDARNVGIEVAQGEFIGFVDSDDWIAPDMIAYLVDGLLQNKAQISMCNYVLAKSKQYCINTIQEDVFTREQALKALFSDTMENYACNKLYQAELWKSVRFPVGKNFEDVLTIYKTFEQASCIVQLPEAKYYYRIRSDSISGTRDFKNRLHIYQAFCDRYRDVMQRHPEYAQELFYRIRRYYCNELSKEIVIDPEYRELRWPLLELLSGFIRENRDELYKRCKCNWVERRMFDAFSRCSVSGCLEERLCYMFLKRIMRMPVYK